MRQFYSNYSEHFRETLRLAYPVSIAHLGHVMLGVVDSMMVGHVGADHLAAASLVNGLAFLFLVFGLGLSLVITPLVAIARGQKNLIACGQILQNGLWFNTIFTMVLSGVIYFAAPLLTMLNQPPEVAKLAVPYAQIIGLSFIPFVIFQSQKQFLEGLGLTKPAMFVMLLANLVNVLGNWLLIFGHWGLPALHLTGAGISTLITRVAQALALLFFIALDRRFKSFEISLSFKKLSMARIKEIVRLGIPTGFQHFFEVGAFSFSAVMIGWLGSKQLAAHQIALSMASMSFMIALGITAAGTIRVGHFLGRNDPHNLKRAGLTTVILSVAVMSAFGLIFILLRYKLPTLFVKDEEVIRIAASLLIIAALFQISDGTQAAGIAILRGLTDVKIPMILSFIAYWIFGLPVGYVLGFVFKLHVNGIWLGLLSGLSFAGIVFLFRFYYYLKKLPVSGKPAGA
ncbi:MATE family efflux transporter [Calditrichota bacterium GD2]